MNTTVTIIIGLIVAYLLRNVFKYITIVIISSLIGYCIWSITGVVMYGCLATLLLVLLPLILNNKK